MELKLNKFFRKLLTAWNKNKGGGGGFSRRRPTLSTNIKPLLGVCVCVYEANSFWSRNREEMVHFVVGKGEWRGREKRAIGCFSFPNPSQSAVVGI